MAHRRPKRKSISSDRARRGSKGCIALFLILFFGIWNSVVYMEVTSMAGSGQPWYVWLFLSPFILIGVGGLVWIPVVIFGANPTYDESATDVDLGSVMGIQSVAGKSSGPLVLTKKKSTSWIALSIAAVIWNAVVAGIALAVSDSGGGSACFLIPFALIGVALVLSVFYQLLKRLNPQIVLRLDRYPIVPGQNLELELQIHGSTHRLQSLEILIEGQEVATYRRGTSTYTDKNKFYDESIHFDEEPRSLHAEQVRFRLPELAVPSLMGSNNKILWQLRVHGVIRWWSDINDPFEVYVQGVVGEPAEGVES